MISFQGRYILPPVLRFTLFFLNPLGNEADFIIISVVRTESPGFLVDKRRTNVMLTRCKKGMVILANRNFLRGEKASGTLIHKLSQAVKGPWLTESDILNGQLVFT